MKKIKTKTQYPGSNRHGVQLTNKDILKKREVYFATREIFDALTTEELEIIKNTKIYQDKKISGIRLEACNDALRLKSDTTNQRVAA
jgi:hypothetical protein